MGTRFLIDSNVIIDFAAKIIPQNGQNFLSQLIDEEFLISSIVRIEVLGFNENSEVKSLQMKEFLDLAILLPVDDQVVEQAIILRRSYRRLKLGDAIIAATAIVNNLSILTRNTNDFKDIEDLSILNPHEL